MGVRTFFGYKIEQNLLSYKLPNSQTVNDGLFLWKFLATLKLQTSYYLTYATRLTISESKWLVAIANLNIGQKYLDSSTMQSATTEPD